MHHRRMDVSDGWRSAFGRFKTSPNPLNSCPYLPFLLAWPPASGKQQLGKKSATEYERHLPIQQQIRNEETHKRHGVIYFILFFRRRDGDGSLHLSRDWINKVLKSRMIRLASPFNPARRRQCVGPDYPTSEARAQTMRRHVPKWSLER